MTKITGSQITSYSTSRNNNSSNTTEAAAKIQTGWLAVTLGGGQSSFTTPITFPNSYTNVPIVVCCFGGDTAAATSTLGSGGSNVKKTVASAVSCTTTGFTVWFYTTDGTAWAANNTVYIQWMAMGV